MKSDKRTFDENTLLLYGITDRTWLCGRSLEEDVRKSLEGGVTFLQIREKHLDDGEFLEETLKLKEVCGEFKVPLVSMTMWKLLSKAMLTVFTSDRTT